jgi:hypothetical protein
MEDNNIDSNGNEKWENVKTKQQLINNTHNFDICIRNLDTNKETESK